MISVCVFLYIARLVKRTIKRSAKQFEVLFHFADAKHPPGLAGEAGSLGEPKANPAGRDNILSGYFGAATPAGG